VRGRHSRGRPADPAKVDPLSHHRRTALLLRDVDSEELAQVPVQVWAREEDQVLGLVRETPQEAVAKDQVLHPVGLPEPVPGERAGGLARVDLRMGVGGEREDHGHAELLGGLRSRQRADVGHPQVEDVHRVRGPQDPTDAAAGGDAQGPRSRGPDGRVPQRDRGVVVAGLDEGAQVDRPLRGATARDGHRARGRAAASHQGVAQVDEEGRDSAVVAPPGVRQRGIDVGVEEELHHGQAGGGLLPAAVGATLVHRRPHVVRGGAGRVGEWALTVGQEGQDRKHVDLTARRVVAERSDGGCPHSRRLRLVHGPREQQMGGRPPRHEAEGLDETGPGAVVPCRRQPDLQRLPHGVGYRLCPRLQGALGEHAREPTVRHHLDERRERGKDRRTSADRPGRVLTKVRRDPVEQGEKRRLAGAARESTERVDGGNGGEVVAAVGDRLGQRGQGRAAAVVSCGPDQVGSQPHAAEDRRRAPDGIHAPHHRTCRLRRAAG
jgi:hypothetical protein